MKLVIDRLMWLRGNPNDSCLLNEQGRRCCLGFAGQMFGVMSAGWQDTVAVIDLIRLNDDAGLIEATREAAIADIFGRHGVEVEFVDGPVSP